MEVRWFLMRWCVYRPVHFLGLFCAKTANHKVVQIWKAFDAQRSKLMDRLSRMRWFRSLSLISHIKQNSIVTLSYGAYACPSGQAGAPVTGSTEISFCHFLIK
jgi:hypothetical protein